MLIKIEVPVSLKIEQLTDLPKLRAFMEDNDLKLNKSEIARQLSIDRRTVSKYLDGFEKSRHRNKPSKMDQYYDTIKELLSSETQIFSFRSVLYRFLKDNYDMNIPEQTFYHYLKSVYAFEQYFKKGKTSNSKSNPVIRYETAPGEQAQFDWKESIPFILAETGEIIDIHVLVILLGHSRFKIYKPAVCMTRETLIHLLTEAFESIGGVPKIMLTDNMKTVMDVARTKEHPGKPNSSFEAFAKDFGFKLVPCIAATPQTKGKVESQMKILEEIRAYSGKLNLVELYELIERMNIRDNNRLSQGSGKIPILEFEKEKNSLLALPHESVRNQYKIKTVKAKVNTAAMINIRAKQYSVPCKYIGKEIQYQIHDSNIYVYFNTKLIAVHEISVKKLNYIPEHYADVLSYKYIDKSCDEISQMAKHNLKIIGGIYSDE